MTTFNACICKQYKDTKSSHMKYYCMLLKYEIYINMTILNTFNIHANIYKYVIIIIAINHHYSVIMTY